MQEVLREFVKNDCCSGHDTQEMAAVYVDFVLESGHNAESLPAPVYFVEIFPCFLCKPPLHTTSMLVLHAEMRYTFL